MASDFGPVFRTLESWVQEEIARRLSEAGIVGRVVDAGYIGGIITRNIGVTAGKTIGGVNLPDHSARHENGGADEISVAGLSGLLADPQTPLPHALVDTTGHTAAGLTIGHVLTATGATAYAFQAISAGSIDHGGLTGLLDDDHTQYALLAGRAGSQTLRGGSAASENLILHSTAHATKGYVAIGGKAGAANKTTLSVFQVQPVSGAEDYYGIATYTSVTGGTSGEAYGAYLASTVGDVGAVNYGEVRGFTGDVYLGLLVNDGGASSVVAWTGTCTLAVGVNGYIANISSGAGILVEGRGLWGAVENLGASTIIRTAYGLYVPTVQATGVDAGQTHNAYGLYIGNGVTASGGATNNAYAIYAASTAQSFLAGALSVEGNVSIGNGAGNAGILIGNNNQYGTGSLFIRPGNAAGYIRVQNAAGGASILILDNSGNLTMPSGYLDIGEIAAPGAPAANYVRLYGKDNAGVTALYYKGEDNVEVGPLGAAGGAAHNILSATHSDSTAAAAVRGDIIVAIGVAPKWERLAKGTNGYVLTMGANEPAWAASAAGVNDAEYVVEAAHAGLSAEVVLGTTVITTATEAARQAAAKAGRLFLPSNGYWIERDTGAAWAPWGPIFPLTAPPAAAGFTWVNQGTSTTDETKGGIFLDGQASGGAGHNIRALVKAKTAPYTITAAFLPLLQPTNYPHAGLAFRQSSDGKLATIALLWVGGVWQIFISKYTNPTTLSANYTSFTWPPLGPVVWMRIADDNTNRICSISVDGQNWMVAHTIGRTDFLTADQVGFYVNGQFASGKTAMNLLHWLEE